MSPAPGGLDHVFMVALAVVFPVLAARSSLRRLQRAAAEDLPRVKLAVYRRALVLQWLFTAAVAASWLASGRPWSALGLVPRLSGGLAGVLVGLALYLIVLGRLRRLVPTDEAALERVRERTRHLERMLPASRRERSWFFALALTAGICEEVLYRGFAIWYLAAWPWLLVPGPPFLAAAVGSSLIFGLSHAYQGAGGVLLTAVVGGFLAAVYAITGSLFAGMLIHALMDLHAGYVSYRAYRGSGETACATAT